MIEWLTTFTHNDDTEQCEATVKVEIEQITSGYVTKTPEYCPTCNHEYMDEEWHELASKAIREFEDSRQPE